MKYMICTMPTFDSATRVESVEWMRLNDGSLIIRPEHDDGEDDCPRLIVPRVAFVKRSEAYTADDPVQTAFAQKIVALLNGEDAK